MTRPAEYWKKRAEANMDRVQEGAEQRLARLGRAYRQAAQELTDEVKRILGTYAKRFDLTPEEAAAALQEPFDEESRAYGYRVSRAEALKAAIQERMNRLGVQVERETAAQREWTASKSYQSAQKMVQDMTGGLVSHATPDLRGMLQAMDTVWAGGNYSARIWKNTERLAETLSSEIEAAFLSGKSVRRMADTIMERFGVGYRAAECLVRTETSYVQNRTAARSYEDAGCTEYEVLTAQDRRTCQYCAKQNDKRYLLATMQAGENAPPFHPNCRCTILPVVEEKGKAGTAGLQFGQKDAMIQTRGNGSMSISSPIEQRNTGKGNPNAILMFDRPLNARQVKLLEKLPELNSYTEVPKHDVSMKDLAALTAYTGCEFALFTKGGQRFIIRGNAFMVNITEERAHELSEAGYRWSGHTHPGEGINVRMASPGDKAVLRQFGQTTSAIWDQHGRYLLFGKDE